MRISLLIPFYAIISFICICFPADAVYIEVWLELVQAICLGTFFLLLCEFVSPSPTHRDVFMAALVVHDKKAPAGRGDGLGWFRVCPLVALHGADRSLTMFLWGGGRGNGS